MTEKPLSIAVIEAVAAKKDVKPTELECILTDAINPVALDALFEPIPHHKRDFGFVEFHYCGYIVTVWADGTVIVQ